MHLAPVQMRTEEERKAAAEKLAENQTTKMVAEAKEYVESSLTSISLTELKRVKEDE